MMDYIKDPDTWLSLLAVVISIIALWQTHRQIKLSNKQQLFDRRLSDYLIAKGLLDLYREHRDNLGIEDNGKPLFCVSLTYAYLTNNSYLEEAGDAPKPPLDNPARKVLLLKIEDLHRIAAEMELIFPKDILEPLNTFTLAYGKMLKALYGYGVIWNQMSSDMFPEMKNWTLGEKADHLGEERYRKEVFSALEQLERAYQAVVSQRSEEKIRELIRL
ncbi:hypothetical protein [Flavonifractor sp. An306]|uniref:hypothetical protein n=1 Tax=Flavonifractor sp. An306 TaxID=1965629 RepID=UPI000B398F9C|nr:hypothetical protein [Flavonifractor sp. An306]OUO43253.1 hypothetical protein B5F88_03005 [Flavonifractor sp. An306]